MQSNLSVRIIDSVRKASKLLIRDFYEIDKLKFSNKILQFVNSSYDRTERILKNEFNRQSFKTMLPTNYSWFIIPIEGRVNFLYGIPYFSVFVALFVDDVPIIVVVDSPIFKETYVLEKGYGANLYDLTNVFKLKVGKTLSLKSALICTNFPLDLGIGHFRCFGSNFLSLLYVASGKFDAFIFKIPERNREQIFSSSALIINESKGKITLKNDVYIASNVELNQDLCYRIT